MNERHIVELALLPLLVMDAVIVGVDRTTTPNEDEGIVVLLNQAILDAVEGQPTPSQAKIIRRANRLCSDLVKPYQTSGLLGLVVFYLLRTITDTGYIEIGQASPLWRAIELFTGALDDVAQNPNLTAEAEREADARLRWLKDRGFFPIDLQASA